MIYHVRTEMRLRLGLLFCRYIGSKRKWVRKLVQNIIFLILLRDILYQFDINIQVATQGSKDLHSKEFN